MAMRIIGRAVSEHLWSISRHQGSLAKLMRFVVVGIASGAIYLAVAAALVHFDLATTSIASTIGYIASIPLNFAGNRGFTFRSRGTLVADAVRYACLHAANITLAAGIVAVGTNVFGLHYLVGLAMVVLVIPLINFCVMQWWVFRTMLPRKGHQAHQEAQ